MSLATIFDKLYQSYAKKLWKCILEESVSLFIQMLIICSLKYEPSEKPALIAKIEKDKTNIAESFKSVIPERDINVATEKINCLVAALTEPVIEDVMKNIVRLQVLMNKLFNENCTVS